MLIQALMLLRSVMSSSNTGITTIFFTPLSIPNIPQIIQPILCLVHDTGRHVVLGGGVFPAHYSRLDSTYRVVSVPAFAAAVRSKNASHIRRTHAQV
jgi:hypothetical protein